MRRFLVFLLSSLFAMVSCVSAQANCTSSSTTAWISSTLPIQTTDFTTTPFTITPTTKSSGGGPIVGLSAAAISSSSYQYGQNATLIRQSDNGNWEVFDGATGGYHAATVVPWTVSTPATFVWSVSITTQTVSVAITQTGGCSSGCTLAAGYKFRTPASSIGFWNLDNTSQPLTVCNLGIATATPLISGVSPSAGAVGTVAVISGSNFGPSQGNSQVSFGGVSATSVAAWNNTAISATVPNNATTGNVIVTVNNQVSNGFLFTVAAGPNPNPPAVVSVQSSVTISLACGPTQPAPVQHSVTLTWTASNSTGVTAYNIYRSTASGSGYSKVASVTAATLNYADANVTSGATYYYVVTAVATNLESTWSNQAAASIP